MLNCRLIERRFNFIWSHANIWFPSFSSMRPDFLFFHSCQSRMSGHFCWLKSKMTIQFPTIEHWTLHILIVSIWPLIIISNQWKWVYNVFAKFSRRVHFYRSRRTAQTKDIVYELISDTRHSLLHRLIRRTLENIQCKEFIYTKSRAEHLTRVHERFTISLIASSKEE